MRLQQFINEATFNISKDVEYIFNKGFKKIFDNINKELPIHPKTSMVIESSELQSEDCKTANLINPVDIYCGIYQDGSYYTPLTRKIQLSVNFNAILIYNFSKGAENAVNQMSKKDQQSLLNEFTGDKIKGTIAHELSHWLDDTIHNFHITQMVTAAVEMEKYHSSSLARKIMLQGKKYIGVTFYEIEAQIHDIKEMKRINSRIWDKISFDEMVNMNGSLTNIQGNLSPKDKVEWKRYLLKRMARAGLIGKMMR